MVYYSADLDTTFGALADPTRRAILERLAHGDYSISELASGFDITLPAVSKHVRVLERAGLATIEKQGRVRRCSLDAQPMRDAAEWIAKYRAYWEASFDRLAAYLDEQSEGAGEAWPSKRRRERSTGSKSGESSTRHGSESSERGRKRRR
jgi:DNA-binding transcriptional ArsR family regulator